MKKRVEKWKRADLYEYFMGRWSRLMADKFLAWLNMPYHLNWLDAGCGTGALSEAIYSKCKPSGIICIDPSEEFLKAAKLRLSGNGDFLTADAASLPVASATVDAAVSGLALNFFSDADKALSEMKRVLKPDGTIAAYVWDYAGRMEFLRFFWDTAVRIDPASRMLDEGTRFTLCNPDSLTETFRKAGLTKIESAALDIKTVFPEFDDYWKPFLGGQGPAPGYLASLSDDMQKEIREGVRKALPAESDGSIELLARAFAVKGKVSGK